MLISRATLVDRCVAARRQQLPVSNVDTPCAIHSADDGGSKSVLSSARKVHAIRIPHQLELSGRAREVRAVRAGRIREQIPRWDECHPGMLASLCDIDR